LATHVIQNLTPAAAWLNINSSPNSTSQLLNQLNLSPNSTSQPTQPLNQLNSSTNSTLPEPPA